LPRGICRGFDEAEDREVEAEIEKVEVVEDN
jgi:hypothetical protein